jgi:MFS family permease
MQSLSLLYAARAVRGFGDGFAVIILPAYLSAIGFDPVAVGLVATASLVGSALATLAIGYFALRHDLRTLLIAGAVLMLSTGLALPSAEHLAFIVIVALVGTVNPTAGDIGVFIPLEHAMLARGVGDRDRTRAFARYSLIGAFAAATGSLAAATPDLLAPFGLEKLDALRAMFYAYAALGLIGIALYGRLPAAPPRQHAERSAFLGPSKRIVFKLAALFSLDAFAGGFIVQSLLALWLFERFGLSLAEAGVFFFATGLLSALSYPVAARLAARVGLVNTMVFTHIPSSVCLIFAAFSSDLTVVLGLLLVRAMLSQMDVPTRSSYVMAVVTPPERAAAASVTAVPRSLAASISPAFAGFLLTTPFPGLPLVVCGALKIVYDLLLLYSFRFVKPPEEVRPPERASNG